MQSTMFISEAQFSFTEMEKLPLCFGSLFCGQSFHTVCMYMCLNNSNDSFQFLSILLDAWVRAGV